MGNFAVYDQDISTKNTKGGIKVKTRTQIKRLKRYGSKAEN